MAADLLYVDGVDVDTLGVRIGRDLVGPRDGPDIGGPTAPVLGRVGHVTLSDAPPGKPRTLRFHGIQVAETVQDLVGGGGLLDRLKRLVYDGVVRVRTGDMTDREYLGTCRLVVGPVGPWRTMHAHTVQLVFTCDDPLAQSLAPVTVGFAGGATECPLGTAVSSPLIRIGDIATNPVVTCRDHLGRVVQTMGFTATLGAGAWLEIDCEQQTIVDQAGAQQAATLTSGDFLELNPFDAPREALTNGGPWPTLEVSTGGLASAEYHKRYL